MAGHRFKPEKAAKLLDPARQKYIPLDQILSLLEVKENDRIADLGCGNGYLTIPLAQNSSYVYGVDIEPLMLDALKSRVEHEGLDNVGYIESNLENIRLDDSAVDKAVVAFVTHEIPDLDKAIEEFKRILEPGSILLVVDWEAIEMEMGPPLSERISSDQFKKILEKHGLQTEIGHLNEGVYFAKTTIG